MNRQEKQAIAEVLESYFTPDSPEGLAGAMYQLRRIYESETRRIKERRRSQAKGHAEGSNHGAPGTAGRGKAAGGMQAAWRVTGGMGGGKNQPNKTTMTPTTRAELATLIPSGGLIIELGVAAGKFAAEMLAANPSIQYLGIDRWSDHHDEIEMFNARALLAGLSNNVSLYRMTFSEARPLVRDESADMIYIDGYAHTGQEGGQTLRDWWPKLKPGGIFAGHDYSGHYPQTIAAVDAFVADHGLELNVIDELPHPSWWLRKP